MKQTIRETVKEQLETLADLNTVRIGRRHAYESGQLNAVSIFTDSEETERITMQPIQLMNTVELKTVYYIKPVGTDLGEDTLDTIVEEADALILDAVAAIDGVFDIVQQSVEIDGNGDADADYLQATRTYRVQYITAA